MGAPTSDSACSSSAWPTPRNQGFEEAPETFHARNDKLAESRAKGASGLPLSIAAGIWSTPAVADVTGGRKARSGSRAAELLLNGQAASLSGRRDPTTLPDGATPCSSGLQLNPLFVEWLMGWPAGWTLFACSGTELSRFKARMRSALSQLASPPAPPVQLGLFG